MSESYLFTTEASNVNVVAAGEDFEDAKAKANLAISNRIKADGTPITVVSSEPITHSVVFATDVLINKRRPSDDILIEMVNTHFKGRAVIEMRNSPQEDGTVFKAFILGKVKVMDLHLDTAELVKSYNERGLSAPAYNKVIELLEAELERQQPKIAAVKEVELEVVE